MEETRHQFDEALTVLERKTLDGFELVIEQLDSALQAVGSQVSQTSMIRARRRRGRR